MSSDPGERYTFKLQGWQEKQWVTVGSGVSTTPVYSPVPKPLGVFSGPCLGYQNVDLKRIDCQIFLQQKMSLFRISRKLQSRVFKHGKPCASPHTKEGEHYFIEREKGSWEGSSKQRVRGFLLAESLPGKKRSLSFSCWALLSLQGVRAPPSGPPTLIGFLY